MLKNFKCLKFLIFKFLDKIFVTLDEYSNSNSDQRSQDASYTKKIYKSWINPVQEINKYIHLVSVNKKNNNFI